MKKILYIALITTCNAYSTAKLDLQSIWDKCSQKRLVKLKTIGKSVLERTCGKSVKKTIVDSYTKKAPAWLKKAVQTQKNKIKENYEYEAIKGLLLWDITKQLKVGSQKRIMPAIQKIAPQQMIQILEHKHVQRLTSSRIVSIGKKMGKLATESPMVKPLLQPVKRGAQGALRIIARAAKTAKPM